MRKWKRSGMYSGSVTLATVASFFIHLLLLVVLFMPWSSVNRVTMPPVVNVRLAVYSKEPEKTPEKVRVERPARDRQRTLPAERKTNEKSVQEQAKKIRAKEEHARKLELKKKQEKERLLVARKREEERARERQRQLQLRKQKEHEQRMAREKQQLQATAEKQIEQFRESARQAEKARISREQKQVAEYVALLRQSVSSHWYYPLDVSGQMRSVVKIMLAPTGEVLSISLSQGSGNTSFDQSVVQAIKVAAPFTFLKQLNIRLFESNFRTVTLSFTPRELME